MSDRKLTPVCLTGNHWMWDSRCFNYGNWETMRFLLSNARWWIDEYKFDGYRFDGVTSMMYDHHGLNYSFTGNYNEVRGSYIIFSSLGLLYFDPRLPHTYSTLV